MFMVFAFEALFEEMWYVWKLYVFGIPHKLPLKAAVQGQSLSNNPNLGFEIRPDP